MDIIKATNNSIDKFIEMNKNEFINIFKNNIKREGSDSLLNYLLNNDFFTAPASSKYHCAFEGGLCFHSLNVFKAFRKDYLPTNISQESIAISTLLHDLCKVNFYEKQLRNRKNEEGKWEAYDTFVVNEKFPFGHGEKSVFIIERYMKLTTDEALAIRFHMGKEEGDFNESARAYEICPLALYTHIADMEATFTLEKNFDIETYMKSNIK